MIMVVMIVRVTVVMRVAVSMPVMLMTVVVCMIMPVMTMIMDMVVRVIMPVRAAVFGLERCGHHFGLEAAFSEQQHDLGIGKHAQAIGEDLDRNVAVAQRQQQPRRLGEILLAHLQHLLHVGYHFDETAVVRRAVRFRR